jgi:UDPglucose--hexose-1-phosphate uridylyltransferase
LHPAIHQIEYIDVCPTRVALMPTRYDTLTDTTVLIAEGRQDRPHDWTPEDRGLSVHADRSGAADCPFCRGAEHRTETPRLALNEAGETLERESTDWCTRVVDNKYPLTTPDASTPPATQTPPSSSQTASRGLHEVIVARPDHQTRLSSLSAPDWQRMLRAWSDRLEHARQLDLAYGACFVNYGPHAGASLAHLHGQLLAVDTVPDRPRQLDRAFDAYHRRHDSCLLCDRLAHLQTHNHRLVSSNGAAVSFAPFASRFPFEICVASHRHRTDLRSEESQTTDPTIPAVASTLTSTLRRLDHALGDPPLNLIVQTAPLATTDERFHWHIDILPALSRGAGFEWGTDWYVNPVAPETAARRLREVELPSDDDA